MTTARDTALQVLLQAETRRGTDLKDLLDDGLREAELRPEDRRLATELVYGCVRWRRRLDMIINELAKEPGRISRRTRCILRLGVYQLLLMDKIPPHAAVNETVFVARRHHSEPGFVNALLRTLQRDGDPVKYADKEKHPVAYLARRFSYPDWLVERWVAEYGAEEAEAICVTNNEPAPLSLRVNTTRTSRAELLTAFRELGITAIKGRLSPTAVYAENLSPLADFRSFQDGDFTVQDESSQLLTELLDPQPSETILDLCAAPGGKTTHIAERMGNIGQVIANDESERGIAKIRENAGRLGLSCIETRVQDARVPLSEFVGQADRVLLDAPCSGLGILRRHADARWGKNEQELAKLAILQLELLDSAARQVKPGGVLVYGVCTDMREETGEIVAQFLNAHPEFQVEPVSRCLPNLPSDTFTSEGAMLLKPHRHGVDGFYAVRFRRSL